MDLAWLNDPATWIGLVTLVILEIVLGVDNIIFISILASKLPPEQRAAARRAGLLLAVVSRIIFLLSIGWVMSLRQPLNIAGQDLVLLGNPVTGQKLVLLVGGLFLIWKAVKEIHNKLEGADGHHAGELKTVTFQAVIAQVLILDVVFSIDSVITAVGMVKHVEIMVAAILIAVAVMLFAAETIAGFVERHPTVKMLALAFLVLIGANLIVEGMGQKIPKGYTYFAMGFAIAVEFLNIRTRKGTPVQLKSTGPKPASSPEPDPVEASEPSPS